MTAAGLVSLGLLAGCVAASPERDSGARSLVSRVSRVAVLPLRNLSANPEESNYLAEGITQAVISRLAQAGVRVTSWETVRAYRRSDESAEAIARALNVESVLAGTFQLAGDRMLTSLTLIDAETGLLSWAEDFEDRYTDLFAVQRRIAVGVAASLRDELSGQEEAALSAPESVSLDAYDLHLQGAFLLQEETAEAIDAALQYFERAVEIDPELVEAHVGLGTAHYMRYYWAWGGGLTSLATAQQSYEQALRLDPADVRARRGAIRVGWHHGLSESMLSHGREAGRLGPESSAETLLARADGYFFAGLPDLAIEPLDRVMTADPMNAAARFTFVVAGLVAREFDRTLQAGHTFLERFGDDEQVRWHLGSAEILSEHPLESDASSEDLRAVQTSVMMGANLARSGQIERAHALWRAGVALGSQRLDHDPDNVRLRLLLGGLFGLLGDLRALREHELRALELSDGSAMEFMYLAVGHAALGHTVRAAEILETQVRRGWLPYRVYLELLAPGLWESEEASAFRRAYDRLEQRLRRQYAPDPEGSGR